MSSVAISPPVRYLESSPGRTDTQIICAGHISSERGIACPTWDSDSIISFRNSSFLIFWFKTFESMVAVLSPNLRLWETFDRIYCQVLHINCPTHRLPCHSLQSTNITCESWTKKPIHVPLQRHLIMTKKQQINLNIKSMRVAKISGKHCCNF